MYCALFLRLRYVPYMTYVQGAVGKENANRLNAGRTGDRPGLFSAVMANASSASTGVFKSAPGLPVALAGGHSANNLHRSDVTADPEASQSQSQLVRSSRIGSISRHAFEHREQTSESLSNLGGLSRMTSVSVRRCSSDGTSSSTSFFQKVSGGGSQTISMKKLENLRL